MNEHYIDSLTFNYEMMSDFDKILPVLSKDFDLNAEEYQTFIHLEQAELKITLSKLIAWLMQEDLPRLIQAMYRMDVNEEAFREALAQQDAEAIAHLSLERQIQKLIFRERYKNF